MNFNDQHIIPLLLSGDESAFEKVYKGFFKALHSYSLTMIRDEEVAEEIVQNVFLKLWERSGNLSVKSTLQSYLYRAVYHESLNYIRHEKVKLKHQEYAAQTMKNELYNEESVQMNELQERLKEAMNELPERCRTVFQLSRFEELKYQEIADQMGISIKTVENQMGKALKLMRLRLADFLPLVVVLLERLFNKGGML